MVIGWSGPGTRTCFSVIPGQPAGPGTRFPDLRRPARARRERAWHDPDHAPSTSAAARALLAVLVALALALTTQSLHPDGVREPRRRPSTLRPGTNQVEVLDATPGAPAATCCTAGAIVAHRDRRRPGQPGVAPAHRRQLHRADRRRVVHQRPGAGAGLRRRAAAAVVLRRADARRGLRLHHHPRRHDAVGQRVVPRPLRLPAPYPTVVEYSGYDPSNPGRHDVRRSSSTPSASPTSASTSAAPAARAARSCRSSRCRASTGTTRSRPSPPSRG